MKDVAQMTAGEINKALDRASAERTKLDQKLIELGRGYERVSDTYEKDDPLSLKFRANVDRHRDLRHEIKRRMGPGATSRLPKGFGPIIGFGALLGVAILGAKKDRGRS